MRIEGHENDYAVALGDICNGYRAFRPPKLVSVSQGAADNLIFKRPGDAAVRFSVEDTPYMAKPMNLLASRNYEGVCFVGPAQSGKTAGLGEGWMTHAVCNDPGDMLMVQMTETKAREYSKQRISRALMHSPNLKLMLGKNSRDSNTHDKQFKHGMWLRIAWPTSTNLSSTSYRYVFITDFDRMPDDIDNEGDAFTLGLKRTTTFMSRGMCAVESSPGRPQTDPNWVPATRHEAPPVKGVLGIYNRSDRQRWYWPCGDCSEWFEAAPGVGLFNLPEERELLEVVRTSDLRSLAAHYAKVACPHCGSLTEYRHRHGMNQRGIWVPDGQTLTPEGGLVGDALRSTIAGFWLGGVAAAYQSWESLLNKHLQGLRDYSLSGSEEALQAAINTDQAMPYMPRYLLAAKNKGSSPSERVEKGMQRYVVPDEARTLVAAVDVQGGLNSRFVVQVHAVGAFREQWLVDRFEITQSARQGMGSTFAQIDPASHPEDWDVLTEQLLRATYKTNIPGKELRVRRLVVDTGGEDGVTANAYAWYRRVRMQGMATKVVLYKGASSKNAPVMKESLLGHVNPREKGDVPVYICNPDLLSDIVDNGLRRAEPGPGYIHFPSWLSPAFFDELGAEVRTPSGWTQIRKRNESFDLCRMIAAALLHMGLDKVRDWFDVPKWLKPLAENTDLITSDERRQMASNTLIANVPDEVRAPVPRQKRQLRRVSTPYLG